MRVADVVGAAARATGGALRGALPVAAAVRAPLAVAIPAFITIIFMPFGYSITVGIGVGFIVYVFMQAVVGRTAKVHPLMWLTAALFVLYFLMDPISRALGIA